MQSLLVVVVDKANNILSVHESCNYVLNYLFPIIAQVEVVVMEKKENEKKHWVKEDTGENSYQSFFFYFHSCRACPYSPLS